MVDGEKEIEDAEKVRDMEAKQNGTTISNIKY